MQIRTEIFRTPKVRFAVDYAVRHFSWLVDEFLVRFGNGSRDCAFKGLQAFRKTVRKTRNKYLATAAECIRLAGQISDPARKLMLLDLAATWVRLADQADKNTHLDLMYETPIEGQRDAAAH